jgi:SAM-dependent methyltransferase
VLVGMLQCGAIPPAASVLEVGCGTGRDSVVLASWGCAVTAVDASGRNLAAARRRARIAHLQSRITFIKGSFPGDGSAQIAAGCVSVAIDTLAWTNFPAQLDRPYAAEVWRALERRGLFVLHCRLPDASHEIASPKLLPASFQRYFSWSRLLKTHLAENRTWGRDDVLAEARRIRTTPKCVSRLLHDWAVIHVGVGQRRDRPL